MSYLKSHRLYLSIFILILSALFMFSCDQAVTQTDGDEIDDLNRDLHNPAPILLSTAEISALLDKTYDVYIEAVINEDVDTQERYWGDHFVAFDPDLPVVNGKREARERLEMYIAAGVDIQSMKRTVFHVWSHKGHIYETGRFDFMIAGPGSKVAEASSQQYVWSWELVTNEIGEEEPRTCSSTCVQDPNPPIPPAEN